MKPIYVLLKQEAEYEGQDTIDLILWMGEDINDARNIILEKLEKDVTFFCDHAMYRMYNTKEDFDYIYIQDSAMMQKYPPIRPIEQKEYEKLIEFSIGVEEVIKKIRQRNKEKIKKDKELAEKSERELYERLKKKFEQ